MENQFRLAWLWPEWVLKVPENGVELSGVISLIIVAVALIFFFISLCRTVSARWDIQWLFKLIENETRETVSRKRGDFIQAAKDRKRRYKNSNAAHLWQEFDETLVEVEKNDQVVLRNTLDGGHFFNDYTLARSVTENRLTAAVPGFLTALGVIGTFIGLQLGLSGLELDGNVEQMKTGIASVVNGAKIAFLTSVWGIGMSLVFNFAEKFMEQGVKKKVARLEARVDWLFPRIRPEEQLIEIAAHGKESREVLQGLAEKIGEKMQESLIQVTQSIQSGLEQSLEKIMAPAINKLVDETSEGNQKALEDLIGKFMESFGHQGAQQRQAMDSASAKVNESIADMSTAMQAMVNRLDSTQTSMVQQQSQFTDQLEQKLASLVAGMEAQSQKVAQATQGQLEQLSQSFSERDTKVQAAELERNKLISEQSEAVKTTTEALVSEVQKTYGQQTETVAELLSQSRELYKQVHLSMDASDKASTGMLEAAKELKGTANTMNVFATQIRDAGNQLSGSVEKAASTTAGLAKQNQETADRLNTLRDELNGSVTQFNSLADKIQQMFDQSASVFDELRRQQNEYLTDQKSNVDNLSDKVAVLLSDYAEQANAQTSEHLKAWSEGTTKYAAQMNEAYKQLASIVESIEDAAAGVR
ncbi:anti-phage ZorAB system protein ZorA [Vreelandella arctica]|mgnify:FL=1|tara:strand:- start:1723 stop:3654 length:1932 start_codon:yes stop_codon:yes gene_type:complete